MNDTYFRDFYSPKLCVGLTPLCIRRLKWRDFRVAMQCTPGWRATKLKRKGGRPSSVIWRRNSATGTCANALSEFPRSSCFCLQVPASCTTCQLHAAGDALHLCCTMISIRTSLRLTRGWGGPTVRGCRDEAFLADRRQQQRPNQPAGMASRH